MFDGVHYDLSSTELDFSGQRLHSLTFLEKFPHLTRLDLRGSGITPSQFDTLQAQHPECRILWDVPFQGKFYSSDRQVLSISSLSEEDLAMLEYFPDLRYIDANGCRDYAYLLEYHRRHSECSLHFSVNILGHEYPFTATHLTLPGHDLDALSSMLHWFPYLQSLELSDPPADAEQILAFRRAHPSLDISWHMTLGDVTLDENTTVLDLTGVPMTVPEVHRLIACLPNLTYLDLSYSGISNEDMAVLRDSYEDVKIVWTVSIGPYLRLKTDATWFIPVKYRVEVDTEDVYNLRYCRDMVCLDLGHMDVENCDFVAFMPHLKYLLLADTPISDITPLTGLTELIYLELFMTNVTDYSPLLTLTALEDLNLHHTKGDPNILAQMTWLKNLWWRCLDKPTQDMLRSALPNTHCEFICFYSTDMGWRRLPNYYAQRDYMGMYYMR